MILLEEAIHIVNNVPVRPKLEEIALEKALGRILAQDIVSRINMPPFDKSAMDGFAFHSKDHSKQYEIVEIIAAGTVPNKTIHQGQCAKIMTGGMVPKGADRIIKKELTTEEDGYMKIVEKEENVNICLKGEDIRIGDTVLKKGSRIRPQEIGVIAAMGLKQIRAYRRPVVNIIATGSELVNPGKEIRQGQIYDSNSFSLAAQVIQTGAELKGRRQVKDERKTIRKSIEASLEASDMVLVSGGVSVGDFDFVPFLLKDLGVEIKFEKIAVKPGKPTVFGSCGDKTIFGVPGNPVSTFVIFEIFIKPLLYRMMGHVFQPLIVQGKLRDNFLRKNTDRAFFIPVHYQGGLVETLPYHGSAHIHALTKANGLICIPKGKKGISAGSKIDVRSI